MLQRRFNSPPAANPGSLLWLVVAQMAAVVAHFSIIPLWLTVFVFVLVVLRYMVSAGKISELSSISKYAIMLMMSVVFVVFSGLQFTVEIAVAFFVLAYSLKTLELKFTRDAYIFAFLTIFLLTLSLLFSQSILLSFYVLTVLGVCFFGLMTINAKIPGGLLKSRLLRIYGMMAFAIPLLVVFYLVFPRFGPLWSMPIKSTSAFTGLGEQVAPGDIANLAQSAERAFRVEFVDKPPPTNQLYWRSLILDRYDGVAWKRSFIQSHHDEQRTYRRVSDLPWEYEITVDPHNREWAFALQSARVVSGNIFQTADQLVRFYSPLKAPTDYRLASKNMSYSQLSAKEQQRYLQLPSGVNPRTNAWAEKLVLRFADSEDRISAVLAHFYRNEYYYTLKPPLLKSDHRVDEFLFDSQRGFCEHYASTMAYVLRKMDIPARVLVGYQGGEWNSQGDFLVVHQYDAHAWIEAWIEGRGWVRFDPTAAVAPTRIENGLRNAMAGEGSFLENSPLSLSRYHHIGVINWMQMQLENLNYEWIKLVVNYDRESQQSLFKKFFGQDSLIRLAGVTILVAVLFFTGLGLAALIPEWRRRRNQPLHYLFDKLLSKMAEVYPQVHKGMTPQQLVAVVDCDSPCQPLLQDIVVSLQHSLYSEGGLSTDQLRVIRKKIKQLKVT